MEINSDRDSPIFYSKASSFFFLSILRVQMETATILNGTRYYVMAVTPTRLYSFTGIGLLDVSLALTPIFLLESWKLGNNNVVKLSDMCSIPKVDT